MKNNSVHAFSALIRHCESLVKPDSTILRPKDGLRWHKLLVKLALSIKLKVPVGGGKPRSQWLSFWISHANNLFKKMIIQNWSDCL